MLALWLGACAYRVTLTSAPDGARVELPSGRVVATPATARLEWVPFGHQRVTASAPGFRPMTVDLRDSEVRLGHLLHRSERRVVELILVPEHGPAGTWTRDDVGRPPEDPP